MSSNINNIRIGTRGSTLALCQADWVRKLLIDKNENISVELKIIKTKGDRIINMPLAEIGGKGLFIKEIEDRLLDGEIDIAVHSMKDMPVEIPEGLCIGAISKRLDSRDVLVISKKINFDKKIKIGTSSLRRSSQFSHFFPNVEFIPIRGNLETRIKKVEGNSLDAIILAAAGLLRLGLIDSIGRYLDTSFMLPAVGQGALCIEVRSSDLLTKKIVKVLNDCESNLVVSAERAFLRRLQGGCHIPIAANGEYKNGQIILTGLVASIDGSSMIRKTIIGVDTDFNKIGLSLAESLLSSGARDIISNF